MLEIVGQAVCSSPCCELLGETWEFQTQPPKSPSLPPFSLQQHQVTLLVQHSCVTNGNAKQQLRQWGGTWASLQRAQIRNVSLVHLNSCSCSFLVRTKISSGAGTFPFSKHWYLQRMRSWQSERIKPLFKQKDQLQVKELYWEYL